MNSGLIVKLVDQRGDGREEVYEYKGGIAEFVALLNKSKEPVHEDVVAFTGEFPGGEGKPNIVVDLAIQWTNSFAEQILCYTNNVSNKDGGTHLTGLRGALTRTLNSYGQEHNLFKDAKNGLTGDDTREGVVCVIQREAPRRELRLADQEQTGLERGEGRGRERGERARRPLLRGAPVHGEEDPGEGRARRQGARGCPQGAGSRAQGRARHHVSVGETRRLSEQGPDDQRALHRRGR